jgi:Phosphatidylinositol 3- and 4-kinase
MVILLAALYSLYYQNHKTDEKIEDSPLLRRAKQAVMECTSPPASGEADRDETFKFQVSPRLRKQAQQQSAEPVFVPVSVKNEWIDMCFGKDDDFLSNPTKMCEFQLQRYQISSNIGTYSKVGLALSRLALGVYVRNIQPQSEASFLGIAVGSVLVSLNGRSVLAEPTKILLDRLWQMDTPVILSLVYHGKISHVILFAPLSGIQWGPAVSDLACIQRVTSAAAAAQIPRGSIVLAVNQRNVRSLDHVQLAVYVRDVFDNHQNIELITALLPVAAAKKEKRMEIDGVEIKFLPLSFALGTLCTQPLCRSGVSCQESVADAVAACRQEAPYSAPDVVRSLSVDKFPTSKLLEAWNPLECLVYCLQFQDVSYHEGKFSSKVASSSHVMEALHQHLQGISTFLLQFLSLISSHDESAPELTSMLLTVSRKDESFCQRLYFMLRSFIAALEISGGDSKNLLALLNCLEMLRFAEKKMAAFPEKTESKKNRLGFLKSNSPLRNKSPPWKTSNPLDPTSYTVLPQSPSSNYDQTTDFLSELDQICGTIEQTLQKTVRQKIADWTMQPWSAGKHAALTNVTSDMRATLHQLSRPMILVNPVESSELLSTLLPDDCYILPSAHFPILLTFQVSETRASDTVVGEEKLYRTTIELMSLMATEKLDEDGGCFTVQACLAGISATSGKSSNAKVLKPGAPTVFHEWDQSGNIYLEIRSSWGAPNAVSLRLSGKKALGFCWIDLTDQWKHGCGNTSVRRMSVNVIPMRFASAHFDEHGELPAEALASIGKISLDLRITTETTDEDLIRKRLLLYKHDDDLRQEALAVQFVQTCDAILKASGLDMRLLTFQCCPVGTNRGFVEWVPGSIPLSEVCDSGGMLSTLPTADGDPAKKGTSSPSKYDTLRQVGGRNESLRRFARGDPGSRGSLANDPIQDFLRNVAYDASAPYFIRRDVMDTYIKSCAGYSVITYILGVGDRHLDNLLLHQSGSFFHCDYTFLLGRDPKKFLPMRITEEMVGGLGGRDCDNYTKFLSLAGAAFLALRRPENVRVLLSLIRLMESSFIPDVSVNQTIEDAMYVT